MYPNAEAAFQAQKCSSDADRIKYTLQKSPVEAERMGKKEPNLPSNWDEISYDIMFDILRAKFSVPELAEMLESTGDTYLEEINNWQRDVNDIITSKYEGKVDRIVLGETYSMPGQDRKSVV